MNLGAVVAAGKQGIGFTIGTIVVTLALGIGLGRLLSVQPKIAQLISAGTAICGGSAIAAVAPVIEADEDEVSVSLATGFILNSIALFLFPFLGARLGLTQQEFGVWAAIAIHDTSSVVGAASKFGTVALQVATIVKLTRALWIVPLTLAFTAFLRRKTRVAFPWFILMFVAAAALRSLVPQAGAEFDVITAIARLGLSLTLLLIGAGLQRSSLRSVGVRPFALGVILWAFVSVAGLLVVQALV
jgi:uncharacterized integral membrane protein (TIGR00698 family)